MSMSALIVTQLMFGRSYRWGEMAGTWSFTAADVRAETIGRKTLVILSHSARGSKALGGNTP